MLVINAFEGQSIRIADQKYRLTVLFAGLTEARFAFRNNESGSMDSFLMSVKECRTIVHGVNLVLKDTRSSTVALGFIAPRSIPIRGEWVKQPECKTQLSSLTNGELVIHARQLGKTELEFELANRLEASK